VSELAEAVRYSSGTRNGATRTCPVCGKVPDRPRATYCSDAHRQHAYRQRQTSTPPALPRRLPRELVVYQCPSCEQRYLGQQRCDECHTFCRRLGPGGPCPHCEEPVAVADLIDVGPLQKVPGRR
jgi:hypothetical protein